jgi:hypothetical protein
VCVSVCVSVCHRESKDVRVVVKKWKEKERTGC